MKTKAAIAWKAAAPLTIEEVDLAGPKAGEVLVEIKATGICHTDYYTGSWTRQVDFFNCQWGSSLPGNSSFRFHQNFLNKKLNLVESMSHGSCEGAGAGAGTGTASPIRINTSVPIKTSSMDGTHHAALAAPPERSSR